MSNTNITDHKSSFLRSQVRLLSAPLRPPSANLQSQSQSQPSTSDTNPTPLPEKAIEDILSKTNAKIKSHNRLVFSTQSSRHVAEQIDALYWAEVVGDNHNDGHNNTHDAYGTSTSTSATREADLTVWINKDVDLCETRAVRRLPATVGELLPRGSKRSGVPHDDDNNGVLGSRYRDARARAVELTQKRDALRKRVEGYRYLRRLLEPFEDATRNVQPNLVTRDGELSRELERMRVLIARVEGGLANDNGGNGHHGSDNEEGDRLLRQSAVLLSDRDKLAQVMDLG